MQCTNVYLLCPLVDKYKQSLTVSMSPAIGVCVEIIYGHLNCCKIIKCWADAINAIKHFFFFFLRMSWLLRPIPCVIL